MQNYDVIIVGGGIVGLATARELLKRHPDLSFAILEKESAVATHQSGHNSGVIHSGLYYKPGSLKAQLCVAGHKEVMRYCDEKGIPFRRCGKVIVALNEDELPRLETLYERGQQNGVQGLEMIGPERLKELEPYCTGIKAIWSPNTGVVDFHKVAMAYADDMLAAGGEIITDCKVIAITGRDTNPVIQTTRGEFTAKTLVTCAGLYSDQITGEREPWRIVPFRGSYYTLSESTQDMVNALIYPVPDPRFPFLGVHFTRTMSDEVWVGPNAVLAFAREGYRRWKIVPSELADTLMFPGFWRLAAKYWKMGSLELYRDFVKQAYVKTAQAYLPQLKADDLMDGPAGVRAQALHIDGSLVDDFMIKHQGRVVHVQNAPSPAATSSIMIGRTIADHVETLLT